MLAKSPDNQTLYTRNPFVGPLPFEEIDQDRFFGRDSAMEELFSMVWAYKTCVVYGQSGSGKSSLVRAGLIPKARAEGMELLPVARVQGSVGADLDLDRYCDPYTYFTLVSWGLTGDDLNCSLTEALEKKVPPLNEYGERVIRLGIFDQFEELFTAFPEYWQRRQSFIRDLGTALEADPAFHVVLIVRQDHLAEAREVAERLPDGLKGQFPLHRLRPQEATEAIDGPVRHLTNRTFEDGVVADLVNDLMKIKIRRGKGPAGDALGEYVEPVQLQVVCTELWRSLPPDVTVITGTDVKKFGDPNEALARFYNSRVTEAERWTKVPSPYIRRWFEKVMITPAGTRAMAYQDEDDTAGLPNATVRVLEDQHLLRAEDHAGARWFELTHDRFIAPIRTANARARLTGLLSYWGVLAPVFFLGLFIGAGLSNYVNKHLFVRGLEVFAAVAILTFGVGQVSHRFAKNRMKPVRRSPGHPLQTAVLWTIRIILLLAAVLLVWQGIRLLIASDAYFRACENSPDCNSNNEGGPFDTWANATAYGYLWDGAVLLGLAALLAGSAFWPLFYIWRISRWQALSRPLGAVGRTALVVLLVTAVVLLGVGIHLLHDADRYFDSCALSPDCVENNDSGPFNTWSNTAAYGNLWLGAVFVGLAALSFAIAVWPLFCQWRIRWQARPAAGSVSNGRGTARPLTLIWRWSGVLAVVLSLGIFFAFDLSNYHNGDLYGRALEVFAPVALLTFGVWQVFDRLAYSLVKSVGPRPTPSSAPNAPGKRLR